ncbi:hypothetical protein H4CHR_02954 [Variovorax sp. PBS-H4]|uniref:hypothetical protein n=1 Tax=Variovorax sp. PBS-H4 TaxID=434008 RepID=UPI001317A1AC|nr:hypothetical protein [Variovorax sp. PBS-H4]VTU32155.1 hypothetical protein H4CHR_02954 [Variovorax sp. PBS-H4]
MSAPLHDDYKRLSIPDGARLEPCPCCGGTPELWQYSVSPDGPATKAVMCSTNEPIGPQDGLTNEGCPLYMPPDCHYRATMREAIKFWNDFAKALTTMRAAASEGDYERDVRKALAAKDKWAEFIPELRGGVSAENAIEILGFMIAGEKEPSDAELQAVIEQHWGYGRDDFLSVARAVLARFGTRPAAEPWKDHQTAALVNNLRDVALQYRDAQQLRERISHLIVDAAQHGFAAEPIQSGSAGEAVAVVGVGKGGGVGVEYLPGLYTLPAGTQLFASRSPAALSRQAPAAPAEAADQKCLPNGIRYMLPPLNLSGYQLREAMTFVAPDGTDEQMEQEVCIAERDAGIDMDGEPYPAGLCCWLAEYPEEGSIPLDGSVNFAAPTPAEPAKTEAKRSLADWRRLYDSRPESILRGYHFTEFVRVGEFFDALSTPPTPEAEPAQQDTKPAPALCGDALVALYDDAFNDGADSIACDLEESVKQQRRNAAINLARARLATPPAEKQAAPSGEGEHEPECLMSTGRSLELPWCCNCGQIRARKLSTPAPPDTKGADRDQ